MMNLSRYMALRLVLYFAGFLLLVITTNTLWPEMGLGRWWILGGLALVFTTLEYQTFKSREPASVCLRKSDLKKVQGKLKELGYSVTDQHSDHMVYLRRATPLRWEIARLIFKCNCLHLEIREDQIENFNNWFVSSRPIQTN